ncbi:MAG: type I methionyl aminopeptidase [Bacteroidia bacterium]|nr:type I methionyl aminopeptidase [Bacteroidia bacterium]MCZ2278238.1 type I methionyl aminopeptidase [Bacteroidia bacterium]
MLLKKKDYLIKTNEEIELIRISSLLVGKTLAFVAAQLKPGISTIVLDAHAEQFIYDQGGRPVFKGYNGFPASLCISVNDEVVHGIPGKRELKDGDIVSVDCGVEKDGYIGDSAYTFAIGDVSPEAIGLMRITQECLQKAIDAAVAGNRIGDISEAVQHHAERNGFGVVRELVGHGVGRHLHEKPEIPNFGKRGTGPVLKEGMVLAIEPMINMGVRNVHTLADGWTVVTADHKPAAHYEHNVVIRKKQSEVLSSFMEILEAERKNSNLNTKHHL